MGTADADVLRLEQQSIFNVSNLLEKAKAARERREAAGISDSVEVRQDLEAPPFDTRLVGKWLEVCWPYKEDGRTVKIWATGRVKRVADGLTDKRSPRARKILPAGMLLWRLGVGRRPRVRRAGGGEMDRLSSREVEQAGLVWVAARSPRAGRHRPAPHAAR